MAECVCIRLGSAPFARWWKAEGGGGTRRLLRVVEDREMEGLELSGPPERLGLVA